MSALGQFMQVFPLDSRKGSKTLRWAVFDRHGGDLGLIEWDNGWRQYVFIPSPACQFSAGCMVDIAHFLVANRGARVALGETVTDARPIASGDANDSSSSPPSPAPEEATDVHE